MAFIRKINRGYFVLVENVWEDNKTKQKTLHYMGKELVIPREVIRKYRIKQTEIQKMREKYPELVITKSTEESEKAA